MSSINFATKEISVKVVFYGPGLGGKTTTLQSIWNAIRPERRPQMVNLATDIDRTIFFDFLPVNAYKIGEFIVRLQLYTVPGQVFYNSTRKLVLNGVDGVVFVADSQTAALDDNRESLTNLADNLRELGMSLGRVPYVLQYNKRDLEDVLSIDALNAQLNTDEVPFFPTVAINHQGVSEVLRGISRLVISDLNTKGVGKKLRPDGPRAIGEPGPSLQQSAEASARQAAESGAQAEASARETPLSSTSSPLSFVPLWPTPSLRAQCRDIELALEQGRHDEAVLFAWELVAAATGNEPTADPTVEVLLRGVPPAKFLRFRELVKRARGKQAVAITDALFAWHFVTELVA